MAAILSGPIQTPGLPFFPPGLYPEIGQGCDHGLLQMVDHSRDTPRPRVFRCKNGIGHLLAPARGR